MKSFLTRLFGRGGKRASTAATPAAMDAEALEEMAEYMRRDIAGGFYEPEQIVTNVSEIMEDDFPPEVTGPAARSLFTELLARHRAEAQAWPEETDCDRLDRAFAALEADGIVARQNFTCCGTCGAAEIGDEIQAALDEGRLARGYAFFHQQDTESAVDGYGLYLNYGAVEEGKAPALRIGHEIVRVIEAHGLKTDWDGKLSRRIAVSIDWKRRWPHAA